MASCLLVALLSGCDWTAFGYGSDGTGANPERTLGPGTVGALTPKLSVRVEPAWSPTMQIGWVNPVIHADGHVVIASQQGVVSLTDDGDVSWSAPGWETSISRAGSTMAFTNIDTGHVGARRASDGEVLWSLAAPLVLPSPPLQVGSLVYVTGAYHDHSGAIHAYDATTGTIVWSHRSHLRGFPTVANRTVYLAVNGQDLVALDAETGAVRWEVEQPQAGRCRGQVSRVAVMNGKLYTSGAVFAADTGRWLWDWPVCTDQDVRAFAVTASTVFVPYHASDGSIRLMAFDATTGAVRWTAAWAKGAFEVPSTPAVSNGVVYGARGNTLVALDTNTGARLWRSPTTTGRFTDPIVSDGRVYALNTNGTLKVYAAD